MCTLAFRFDPGAAVPLVVAANRDERLDRPAESWAVRSTARGTRFVGPRDVTAGGTWMGVNAHGLFVGITNHHVGTPPDPARRSRGMLVDLALSQEGAEHARRGLGTLDYLAFNPFHLVLADAHACWMWHGNADRGSWEQLLPGVHVVTESSAHDVSPRGALARRALDGDTGTDAPLHDALATHGAIPRDGLCLHLGDLYGTRSSAVIRLARTPARTTLSFTDGPPCTWPRQRGDALMATLVRAPSLP